MKNSLSTEYSKEINRDIPWQDYPRPIFKRDSYLCLNGLWDFAYSDKAPTEYETKILVPFPPESALSGIEKTHKRNDRLYYRRHFTLPDNFFERKVILHFGAVDQCCEVFINQTKVGSHEGGYIPFSFEISEFVHDGENELTVIALDPLSTLYPYGKQRKRRGGMWYTEVSGIWQTVWLESIPEKSIEEIKIKNLGGQ